MFCSFSLWGQVESSYDLSKSRYTKYKGISSKYTYNPKTGMYLYTETIEGYPINAPMVLSPKEFEAMLLAEQMKGYFQGKIAALSGNAENLSETQKNLLPEVYINSKFFQSIFGSNLIDIVPQGSVGIDLGVRYQKNDNPAASPRNRRSFGFDFDQRISLSLLGKIGDRLQITANYDTESTFDFQNLVKIEFNPPQIAEVSDIIPESVNAEGDLLRSGADKFLSATKDITQKAGAIQQKIGDFQSTYDEAKQKILNLKAKADSFSNQNLMGLGNNVTDYLNGKVTEDAILQNISIGNISMPLNSNLIQGAQSLFGVRTDLKFGKTTISAVFSEQRSQSQNVIAQGGGTLQEFSIFALDYEEDRHYFLAQYFRDNYDKFLKNYPYINSPIQITRIEVWITNRGSQTRNIRNIVGFQDLGESDPGKTTLDNKITNFFNGKVFSSPPANENNRLDPDAIGKGGILSTDIRDIASIPNSFGPYNSSFNEGFDYAVLESARKLSQSEYKLHPQLGYISLNQRLSNDEVLAVAFQYTFKGKIYQVGEFANGGVETTSVVDTNPDGSPKSILNNNLVVKMLKSNITDVHQPIWDLMMKNIYNTGAFQLSEENFRLNILYSDPSPINYLTPIDKSIWPENMDDRVLLNTFNLDKLNFYKDPQPEGDGFFDYIPGVTIEPQYGRIIFPNIEPFGEYLFRLLDDPNSQKELYKNIETYNVNQKRYVFSEMYLKTKAAALETTEKNKFQLKGRYKSEGGDGIPIGAFNVPRGSVKVTAGGRVLREGIDYTVNYAIGRVKILDPALQASNVPINISVENNSFFNQQNKRFSGFNIVHKVNDKVVFGGTLLNLSENPLTQKANYGTEPVNNTMIGFNTNFSTELPFLTRWVNKIPSINTNVPSILSFRGEVANLIAGRPKNTQLQGESNVYIDDFEGAQTNIDIKGFNSWKLSSVPYKNFKGSEIKNNEISRGFGRSKLAWYSIDPIFYAGGRPSGINNDDISLNTTRRIFIKEIFPEQDLVQGTTTVQSTLDLAYFPEEKGPYNNVTEDEFKKDRAENWAGIMRPINATNFEQSNVEFIEFWLLDTFSELSTMEDDLGELYLHLGNISEDILKDGRKQFENGLPGPNSQFLAHETSWGMVPSTQSLLYAFNTIPEDREAQDVGLDGLDDIEEGLVYTNGPKEDPAGDNYQFFVSAKGGVLERYKNYNGTQGNSPVAFSDTNRGNTTEPDSEDINRDQSMNTIDSYFEYRVPISKTMGVGNHPFITDVRENVRVSVPNGDEITTRWIQFKIPVQKGYYQDTQFAEYFEAINNIEDLRSIRFMRMVLKGFTEPVVLRFGTLDLVRGDWRRYNQKLNKNLPKNNNTTVDISTVNILENENRIPINYVLPPDIQREQINNNNTIVRQNEQSMTLRICDLQPMDYRAVFKNVNVDIRQYKNLKMFLHAESIVGQKPLPGEGTAEDYDRRMVAFIRLGTDFLDNYYQVEIPLKPTDYKESSSNKFTADEVWQPESNALEVPIKLLSKLKAVAINNSGLGKVSYFDEEMNPVSEFSPISALPGFKKYKFAVKGNPSLGSIKTLMIGVKNPSNQLGDDLCGEVWFNELRIAGIDSKGGWAAVGAMDANFADLANVAATARISTIGFGSIDQTPNQSNREDMKQYDLVTNINLGKLMPEKWGLQIPLNLNIGETFITPEYDPFYQDILFQDRLDNSKRNSQRDSINDQAIDYTLRKSISLIGVRKNKTGNKPTRFFSPENFDFSYAYNELYHQDYEIKNQTDKNLQLGVNYGHSFKQLEINPFRKISGLNGKLYWQWLRELNFNLIPSNIEITSNINRSFSSQRFRQVYMEGVDAARQIPLPNLQLRNYLFDWSYTLSHNLTRSLRFNFTASNNNIVRNFFEKDPNNPLGRVNKSLDIWNGIWDTGQTDRHFQSLSLNYKIPIRLIPFLNFIDANYNYTGDFSWQRGSNAMAAVTGEEGQQLGVVNAIQNANTKTLTGSISFDKLYTILRLKSKKSPFDQPFARGGAADNPQSQKKENKPKKSVFRRGVTYFVDLLSSIKRAQFNYSENNGKVIPGYLPNVGFMGTLDPSFGFTFGSQADVRYEVAKRGWLTNFPNFNEPFVQVHNSKLNISAQINPLKDLTIDLNAERNYSNNLSENYQVQDLDYIALNTNEYGNFGISTILIKTAFSGGTDIINKNFTNFRENRLIIANRLAAQSATSLTNRDENGFPEGFSKNHQTVLTASFISAYSGTNPDKISFDPIQGMPLPNWNFKYTGLSKIKSLAKIFNRFSLTHGYRSSYTLTNYQTNLEYDPTQPLLKDKLGNYMTSRFYSNINLAEQFNPLIRFDVEFKNSLKILAEMRRDRSLSLSLDNSLLTEQSGNEYILGMGYRLKDLRIRTNLGGRRVMLSGDLNLKADFSYRKNITLLRNLEYDNNQVTAGQTIMSIKFSAGYNLSKNLTSLLFYDHNFSEFAISTAFPQTSIRSGITIRYNFGN
ncbi:MAG: cell surface protein SprA [Bacteroidota bacterium]|nr:cell surface protein SprA [Bacteroidota bacterium]